MSRSSRLVLSILSCFVLLAGCGQPRIRLVETTPTEVIPSDSIPKKIAILIGVGDYENMRGLLYTKNDILALRERLLKIGFEKENVFCLTCGGSSSERPSKERIENMIDTVLGLAGANDVLWLALCGHGAELEGESKPRFCPIDAKTNNVDDLKRTTILLEEIYEKLAQCRARFKLMTVDACRNDPFISRSGLDVKSLQTLSYPPRGCILLYSCSENEISLEDDKFQRGIFSHYMIEGLDGEAARDGKITVLDLIKYATEQTQRRAVALGKRQRPRLSGDLNDFVLATVTPLSPIDSGRFDWRSRPRQRSQNRLTWTFEPDGRGEIRLEKVEPHDAPPVPKGEPFKHPLFPMISSFREENGGVREIFDFRDPELSPIAQWAKGNFFRASISKEEGILLFQPENNPLRRKGTRHAFVQMKQWYRAPFVFSCDIDDCDFGNDGIAVFRLNGKPFGDQLVSLRRDGESNEKWLVGINYLSNRKAGTHHSHYAPSKSPLVTSYRISVSEEDAKTRTPLEFQVNLALDFQFLKISRMEFLKDGLCVPMTPASGTEIFLADYPWETADIGWDRPGTGSHTSFAGRTFEKSIYAHASSRYVYLLDGKWRRFVGTVGLKDKCHGDVYFIAKGDGREIWRSELATPSVPEQDVSLDIFGVEILELIVDDADNGNHSDEGIWFDPKLKR